MKVKNAFSKITLGGVSMQGELPCRNNGECPYGRICEQCPELRVREEDKNLPRERGGFYGKVIQLTIGPDGKKHYEYSHPE